MECLTCHVQMIKRYDGITLDSYPPQYPWFWWYGCGAKLNGGIDRGQTEDEQARAQWEEANRQHPATED